jgi:hypothetical protein
MITNLPLYRALVKLGVADSEAESASRFDPSDLATKADLAELKAEMLKWGIGILFTGLGLQTALILLILSKFVKP